MDINLVIARAKAILLSPKTEWPVIAERPETVAGIYKEYLVVIAAVPAVFGFIQASILGIHLPFGGTFRVGLVAGLVGMVIRYAVSLGAIYVLAIIVEALAPNFGGQKNRIQALKAVAYGSTAGAVASAAVILPLIGPLVGIAGGLYTLYLLYLGLPVTMKAAPEKALPYTGLVVAAAFAVGLVLALIAGSLGIGHGMAPGTSSDVQFDKNSTLGQLQDWSKKTEAATKTYEEAQKSGDAEAQQKAMGQMMGAVFSGGDVVESLEPEKIKGFLPDALGGLPRGSAEAARNEAMGMQISNAQASYSDGADKSLALEITDMGSAKGFAAAASWASVQEDKVTDTGYEKTYKDDGRIIHEQWDKASGSGEYSVIVADRFAVKVTGHAGSIDTLKSAAETVDLAGLDALKGEGVKKGG